MSRLAAATVLLLTVGCGGMAELTEPDSQEPGSTGGVVESPFDAGLPNPVKPEEPAADAGDASDAGTPDWDAGQPEPDAGAPDWDAGQPEPDAGAGEWDAGQPGSDAGTGGLDSGQPRVDSGTPDAGARDSGVPDAGQPPLNAKLLDTAVVSLIVEPEGSGHDDSGAAYTDLNYWNFCVPGAVTAALYYWKPANVTGWAAGHFREPSNAPSTIPAAGTYWTSDDTASGYHSKGRAYLMHLAMQVRPPSYTAPGIASFTSYPSTGAGLVDGRDALNWEASGHASNWSSFFYAVVNASAVTQTKLHADIKADINGGHAVVVFADTAYLPNWSRSLWHAITVVGYDDTAGTYRYIDTCGKRCNGSTQSRNGGVWTLSQSALTNAARNGAGYLW